MDTPLPTGFTRTIATRELAVVRQDHVTRLQVEIGEPVQDVDTAGGWDWRCPVRWIEGGSVREHSLYGVDAMQALQQAMHWIAHEQAALAGTEGVSLRFLDWPFDVATQLPVPPQDARRGTGPA